MLVSHSDIFFCCFLSCGEDGAYRCFLAKDVAIYTFKKHFTPSSTGPTYCTVA
jgi:hypothetical protein